VVARGDLAEEDVEDHVDAGGEQPLRANVEENPRGDESRGDGEGGEGREAEGREAGGGGHSEPE